MVATVQRCLAQLGYHHDVVDGVVGPRTRNAMAAFENRNGLVVSGRINRPLLDTIGVGLAGTNRQPLQSVNRRGRSTKRESPVSFNSLPP
jgi:peptidoglycan hydrolase-like protein with peptidoglycan-binding domain